VKERPQDHEHSRDEQTKDLVAAKEATLLGAPRVLFQLLLMRLDAALNRAPLYRNPDSSIGAACLPV